MDNSNPPIVVHPVAWMQQLHPINNNVLKFFAFAKFDGRENTLVILDGTGIKGQPWLYCQVHNFVYPIKGFCQECENALEKAHQDASVTTCNTPN